MRLERKKGISGIKIHHNKKLFWVIIALVLVLIGMMIYVRVAERQNNWENSDDNLLNACVSDDDCIKQKLGCCSCSMGGTEICMSVKNSSLLNEKLASECGPRTVCTAMYACQETSCACIDGKCIEK